MSSVTGCDITHTSVSPESKRHDLAFHGLKLALVLELLDDRANQRMLIVLSAA